VSVKEKNPDLNDNQQEGDILMMKEKIKELL